MLLPPCLQRSTCSSKDTCASWYSIFLPLLLAPCPSLCSSLTELLYSFVSLCLCSTFSPTCSTPFWLRCNSTQQSGSSSKVNLFPGQNWSIQTFVFLCYFVHNDTHEPSHTVSQLQSIVTYWSLTHTHWHAYAHGSYLITGSPLHWGHSILCSLLYPNSKYGTQGKPKVPMEPTVNIQNLSVDWTLFL